MISFPFYIDSALITLVIPNSNEDTMSEYPPKADLRKDVSVPLPEVPLGTVEPTSMNAEASTIQAKIVLDLFNDALASKDMDGITSCFYARQAYWRDYVALTSHSRTLSNPHTISKALIHLFSHRRFEGKIELTGDAMFVTVSPTLVS